MSTGGLVWLDRRGNPIPLSYTLGAHVEATDQNDLWNSIKTRKKVHTLSQPIEVAPPIALSLAQTHPHDHPPAPKWNTMLI